jgi:hypothetical protein
MPQAGDTMRPLNIKNIIESSPNEDGDDENGV